MWKRLILLNAVILWASGCGDPVAVTEGFEDLFGGSFVFDVSTIAEQVYVMDLDGSVPDSEYVAVTDQRTHIVRFSAGGRTVSVEGGHRLEFYDNTEETLIVYETEERVFPAYALRVWRDSDHYSAELTVFGSGVPVIQSERGMLIPLGVPF